MPSKKNLAGFDQYFVDEIYVNSLSCWSDLNGNDQLRLRFAHSISVL